MIIFLVNDKIVFVLVEHWAYLTYFIILVNLDNQVRKTRKFMDFPFKLNRPKSKNKLATFLDEFKMIILGCLWSADR